jgi:hypothetical protein
VVLTDIGWRITNAPNMKTFYVTFLTDDDTLVAINEWLTAQNISLLTKRLRPGQWVNLILTTGNRYWSDPHGELQFETEEGAALFRLTWC